MRGLPHTLGDRMSNPCKLTCVPWELSSYGQGPERIIMHQVAEELTAKDVIRAHARDELGEPVQLAAEFCSRSSLSVMPLGTCPAGRMSNVPPVLSQLACLQPPRPGEAYAHTAVLAAGIDLDDLTNPYQAAAASALAFCLGGGLPLLAAAFIHDAHMRILSVVCPCPKHSDAPSVCNVFS